MTVVATSVTYPQLGDLILTGRDAVTGVEYITSKIDGWGAAGTTLSVTQRPASDGGWSGDSFREPRSISLAGWVKADDPVQLSLGVDRLHAACSLSPTPLSVTEQGRTRTMIVRRSDTVIGVLIAPNLWQWSAQFLAEDPRKYGPSVSAATALPSSSGGLTFPVTYPVTYTGTSVTGIASIYNDGNVTAPLMVRFDGPVTGPRVTHVQTGRSWAATGFTLAAGEFWLVDMDRRQALAQGQASRSGYITSRGWMDLQPGQNDYAFAADSYNAASLMTVTAASAWE